MHPCPSTEVSCWWSTTGPRSRKGGRVDVFPHLSERMGVKASSPSTRPAAEGPLSTVETKPIPRMISLSGCRVGWSWVKSLRGLIHQEVCTSEREKVEVDGI
ncbi:hypothetical protein M408DRAFT_197186 [Serendipita vermifera MAFF 305830]|uniref:Uncharacterized protein n=1 Tax=Serendipita vermifera MAFF 305830 TaxID=933852 RepID=A0A0C2XAH5_SERVB|nr:hypothetical protein M408DRAFT_197186 [Serendipita vermifera MAFF 305830]